MVDVWLIGNIHAIPPLLGGIKAVCGIADSSKGESDGFAGLRYTPWQWLV